MRHIGRMLLTRGWVTDQQLALSIRRHQELGGTLGTCLLETGAVSEELLLQVVSDKFQVAPLRPEILRDIPPEVIAVLTAEQAARYRAIPVRSTPAGIDVAVMKADDIGILDELAFIIGQTVRPVVTTEARIHEALSRYYGAECPVRLRHLLARLNRTEATFVDERSTSPTAPAIEQSPPADESRSTATPAPGQRDNMSNIKRLIPEPPADPRRSISLSPDELASLDDDAPNFAATDVTGEPVAAPATLPAPEVGTQEEEDRRSITAHDPFDDIRGIQDAGAVLLDAMEPHFAHVLLFQIRNNQVIGWRGRGEGIRPEVLSSFQVSLEQPSIFLNLNQSSEYFLGALPKMPSHDEIGRLLSANGHRPICAAFPVRVRGRMVLTALGHRGDNAWGQIDLPHIRSLTQRTGEALEACILRDKTRKA